MEVRGGRKESSLIIGFSDLEYLRSITVLGTGVLQISPTRDYPHIKYRQHKFCIQCYMKNIGKGQFLVL